MLFKSQDKRSGEKWVVLTSARQSQQYKCLHFTFNRSQTGSSFVQAVHGPLLSVPAFAVVARFGGALGIEEVLLVRAASLHAGTFGLGVGFAVVDDTPPNSPGLPVNDLCSFSWPRKVCLSLSNISANVVTVKA